MDMNQENREHRFVVLLNELERAKLQHLADKHGLSKAQLIRLRVLGDWAPREHDGEHVPCIDQ